MSVYKTILVVLGPERRLTAGFHRGVEFARRSGATLHLCLFDYQGLIDTARAVAGDEVAQLAQREFIHERMDWLGKQAAALADRGMRVECDVVWAPVVHEAVLGKALEIGADLVIKDVACDKHTPPRLHATPLDWKLLRQCPVALMLVRPEAPPLPRRLLAAVDVASTRSQSAALNERLLQTSLGLANFCEAELDAISVYSYVPLDTEALGFAPEIYDIVDTAHRTAFERFISAYPVPSDHQHRQFGEPADAIAQCAAERQIDLTIIGSAYHSGWDRFLFGSTAESLLRQIGSDVLILKPDGFVEQLARHLDLNALRKRYAKTAAQTASPEPGSS
jgi:universal stress protein E